jgi:hypothetical protein
VSERERKIAQEEIFKRKKGLEAGVSNVPLLLACYSQYYTKGEELCRGVLRIAPKLQLMLVHPSHC